MEDFMIRYYVRFLKTVELFNNELNQCIKATIPAEERTFIQKIHGCALMKMLRGIIYRIKRFLTDLFQPSHKNISSELVPLSK